MRPCARLRRAGIPQAEIAMGGIPGEVSMGSRRDMAQVQNPGIAPEKNVPEQPGDIVMTAELQAANDHAYGVFATYSERFTAVVCACCVNQADWSRLACPIRRNTARVGVALSKTGLPAGLDRQPVRTVERPHRCSNGGSTRSGLSAILGSVLQLAAGARVYCRAHEQIRHCMQSCAYPQITGKSLHHNRTPD
jgi:hypothetical protein